MDGDSVKICPRCNKQDITSFRTCRFCNTKYDTKIGSNARKLDLRSSIFLVVFAALVVYGLQYAYNSFYFHSTAAEREDMPSNLPALLSPPIQVMLSPPPVITLKGFTLTKVASYVITGRILCTADHWLAPNVDFGDLSPIDLGLGWGFMADKRMMRQMWMFSGARVMWSFPPTNLYRYYPEKQLIKSNQIYANMSHNHIIPANDQVRKIVESLRRDQVVKLTGALVNVTNPGRILPWETSLSRDDSGCEIMYVENMQIY